MAVGLDLEHAARDQLPMAIEEPVQVVAVHGRATIEAVVGREGREPTEVAPARPLLGPGHAAQAHHPAGAEEPGNTLSHYRLHPAYIPR